MTAKRSGSRKRKPKPRIGDVFEVETEKGFGYLQYVNRSPVYGELVRVFPGTYRTRPESFDDLLESTEAFLSFLPIARAVSDGLITWVNHRDPPSRFKIFPMMRWGTAPPKGGGPRKWRLFDGEHLGEFRPLTPSIAKLSTTGTPDIVLLRRRIETGYRPEDET
jgi:hypothetical protein